MDNFLEKFLYFFTITVGIIIGLPVFVLTLMVFLFLIKELIQ